MTVEDRIINEYPNYLAFHWYLSEKSVHHLSEDQAIVFDAFHFYFSPQQLPQSEMEVIAFVHDNWDSICRNVDEEKINKLSTENAYQFLFSVLKKIRERRLASQQNQCLEDEIQQIVIKCQDDARSAEARDLLIKFFPGLPLKTVGIEIDPKNIFGSIKRELFKKLSRGGSEERNKQLMSEEKIVTKSLLKLFISIILLIFVISNVAPITMFGITIHQNLIVGIAVICFVVTGCQIIKGLFSNNQEGSIYHPSSRQDYPPFRSRFFQFSANTDTSEIVKLATDEGFSLRDFDDEIYNLAKRFEDDYKELLISEGTLKDNDNNVTSVTSQNDISNAQELSTTVSNPEVCNVANPLDSGKPCLS